MVFEDIVAVEVVPGREGLESGCAAGERTHRVKTVAFGSGLAMIVWSHIRDAREVLKLIAVERAWTAFSLVMFPLSWGRKPWFARVFIIGHGPRT